MCYGLITWANRNLDSSIVTAFWPLQVFVSVLLAHFVLKGESITAEQWGGGGMIVLGLLAVVASNLIKSKAP